MTAKLAVIATYRCDVKKKEGKKKETRLVLFSGAG